MRHHSPVRVLALAPLDGRVNGDGALTCVATNSRTPTIHFDCEIAPHFFFSQTTFSCGTFLAEKVPKLIVGVRPFMTTQVRSPIKGDLSRGPAGAPHPRGAPLHGQPRGRGLLP